MFDFEKFTVYVKSEEFYSLTLKVLKNKNIDKIIRDQFKRASLSIVLNIAEWAWKYSKNDKRNFYSISRWSVNECIAILRILKLENIIDNETMKKWIVLLTEIAKMLTWMIISMGKS